MERNVQILDTELAKNGNSEYRMKELLNWRVDTMAALGVGKTVIDPFWTQYRHLSFVREREINRLLDEKDYDSAIRLLRESKELDKGDDFQVRGYNQKLIDIYQQTGQTEPLREELRFQIFNCVQRDLTYIIMSRSTDRNMYREAIGCLRRVRQFPAGAEAEKQLADSWRVQFGRRKAMIDELRKAGY